ncbi:hypothetical protein AB0K23_01325 [Streptomyces sp. NPDC049602]|uniref:hypothetical protein n=1 Tax=Streptomyces sp. NPDC049602 TaxID=3155504 RepID=UPI00342AE805
MTQPSPADVLRTAAKELRDHASTTSPAPWAVNQWGNVETAEHEEMAEVWPLQAPPGDNAAYIALMGPDVGTALADLLDETASEVAAAEGTEYELLAHEPGNSWTAALAVARAITGDTP